MEFKTQNARIYTFLKADQFATKILNDAKSPFVGEMVDRHHIKMSFKKDESVKWECAHPDLPEIRSVTSVL